MPRAVWTGSLSFGLVSIPVALYPATSPKDVRFHLFDRQGRRVRYRRFAEPSEADAPPPLEEEEHPTRTADEAPAASAATETEPDRGLAYSDLVRGYEVEPGRFAMLEHEEIEQAKPTRSTTIDLEDFVELDDIDPVFFEKTYYLAPRRGAEKPYSLLHETLRRTARVGIGRFVLRTKPHLVAVRAGEGAIVLETLFFGDEVRSPAEVVTPPGEDASERELRIAEQLVEMLAASWDPSRYADEYRDELLRIISEKEPTPAADATDEGSGPTTTRAEELMEALKRSVEEAKAKQRDTRRAG